MKIVLECCFNCTTSTIIIVVVWVFVLNSYKLVNWNMDNVLIQIVESRLDVILVPLDELLNVEIFITAIFHLISGHVF